MVFICRKQRHRMGRMGGLQPHQTRVPSLLVPNHCQVSLNIQHQGTTSLHQRVTSLHQGMTNLCDHQGIVNLSYHQETTSLHQRMTSLSFHQGMTNLSNHQGMFNLSYHQWTTSLHQRMTRLSLHQGMANLIWHQLKIILCPKLALTIIWPDQVCFLHSTHRRLHLHLHQDDLPITPYSPRKI